ncbi:hypothetical protein E2C01_061598 [Portunus trituberculatus]|uniref:Uncharacterized protein n=1 Tax=Portunus trituberculatus TaxID=210409 RepID=A0A5B7HBE9_PORTR|nr:hypothetical protein [Portunus trituberculatus]
MTSGSDWTPPGMADMGGREGRGGKGSRVLGTTAVHHLASDPQHTTSVITTTRGHKTPGFSEHTTQQGLAPRVLLPSFNTCSKRPGRGRILELF